ncbi:MAG: hypothetical protein AAF747_12085, partial [Planctomycetota bacterium]
VQFRNSGFVGNTALYTIDPATGQASNPREIQADVALGLAFDGQTLFSATDSFGQVNGAATSGALFTIDPMTGATQLVGGDFGIGVFSEGDLAVNQADGGLYLVTSSSGTSGLYSVDKATGAAAFIGNTDAADASAMAFTSSGDLYILDTTSSFPAGNAILREVDLSTGATISSITLNEALGTTAGMAFDASGNLFIADGDFGGTNDLYSVDMQFGLVTAIGTTVAASGAGNIGGLSGLTFVPAPSGAAAFAAVGVLAARRRRH